MGRSIAALGAALMAAGAVSAQESADLGRITYRTHCASCHGPDGEGDGPMAQFLAVEVPDLTTIQRDNGGVFPFSRVYGIIEGGGEEGIHGASPMPAWGERLISDALILHGIEVAPTERESFVRARILALIDHVAGLQRQ